jgi:hypothetical protein
VASYPLATSTAPPKNYTFTPAPLTPKKGNYKIIRGKDGKLKAVLIEGKDNYQPSVKRNEPVLRSVMVSTGKSFINKHKDNVEYFFFRTCLTSKPEAIHR